MTTDAQHAELGTHICRDHYLANNHDGSFTAKKCQFPRARIQVGTDVITLKQCVFHTLEDINESKFSPPKGIDGSDVVAQLEVQRDKAIEGVFDPEKSIEGFDSLGTKAFPIIGYSFEKLTAENLSRSEELILEQCHVKGVVFFKNCQFSRFCFEGTGVDRLTFTKCTVQEVNFECKSGKALHMYLNNSHLGLFRSVIPKIGDVRLEDSAIHAFAIKNFSKVSGQVISIRSTLNFFGGDFSSATVGVSDKVSFSRSIVRGCVFLTKNFDDWRRLKLAYNQNSSFLAVLLLIAFALPIALDVAYWQAVAGLQDAYRELTMPGNTPTVSPCLSSECRQVSLLWLVSGANQGILYVGMTSALLLLNVVRVILVSECAIIREWEEQAGLYPEKGTFLPLNFSKTGSEGMSVAAWRLTYGRLIPLDWLVRSLLYVSIISFAINAWDILQVQVLLPR